MASQYKQKSNKNIYKGVLIKQDLVRKSQR